MTKMPRRPLGRTGMEASIIGLGCEHLEGKDQATVDAVIGAALDHGINIMDIFMPGDVVRERIGRALAGRRNDVLIQGHLGVVNFDGSFRTRDISVCQKGFDALLKYLQTDYIDLGMMFYIETESDFQKAFETPHYDYICSLKKSGVIRAIGASTHNAATALRMVEGGYLDTLMFSINPAFDRMPPEAGLDGYFSPKLAEARDLPMEHTREKLYTTCAAKGVGITAMKSLAAGWLLNANQTPFRHPLTVAQCAHYALTRPGVASVLVGCATPDEVAEACRYPSLSDIQRDYRGVIMGDAGSLSGKCMYCNHCLPCPADLDIAALTNLLDRHRIHTQSLASLENDYAALEHKAGACLQCGQCEQNCPFGVSVMQNMRECATLFEGK